jgi:hypothetical protein
METYLLGSATRPLLLESFISRCVWHGMQANHHGSNTSMYARLSLTSLTRSLTVCLSMCFPARQIPVQNTFLYTEPHSLYANDAPTGSARQRPSLIDRGW